MAYDIQALAGQRLMVGFDATALDGELRFYIAELGVAGVILFARNIETPEQVRGLIGDCQACAAATGRPPLLVAVDQEGGSVARLHRPHFPEFAAAPQIPDAAAAEAGARAMARMLRDLGFNMNMAPVLDVAPAGMDSVMAPRAFGADPGRVGAMGAAVIDGLQAEGIMAVAKHFPGIGRTTADSHKVQPVLDASAESLAAFDLPPFARALSHNVAGVMLSHIRYPALDPDWPASLSAAVVRDLLRGKMGYDGLVMTDDLDMGAIRPAITIETAAARILAADVDLALICHAGPAIEAAHGAICRVIEKDPAMHRRAGICWQRMRLAKQRWLGRGRQT